MALQNPVERFLKQNKTFKCVSLSNARMTPDQCVARQLREVETKYFGRKITVNNTIFDRYCRSGCCKVGLVHLKKLLPEAHRVRVREAKATKNPCKPLGDATCPV